MYQADFIHTPVADAMNTMNVFLNVIAQNFSVNVTGPVDVFRKNTLECSIKSPFANAQELLCIRFSTTPPITMNLNEERLTQGLLDAGFFSMGQISRVQYFTLYEDSSVIVIVWTSVFLALLSCIVLGLGLRA
jgi:hypothetical protein